MRPRAKPTTITDVAREAGVSVATVSRALRGLDRVSPATRAHVAQVAERLNYVASPTATSLASGRTRVVGVVTPFLNRWYFSSLLAALEKTLRAHGHHALLIDLEGDRFSRRQRLTLSMVWKRVDGVIVLEVPLDAEELDILDRLGMPVASVGQPLPSRPCVRIDDLVAMGTATQHLLDLGHADIAYIGTVPADAANTRTPWDRLNAFRSTLAAQGLRPRTAWVVDSDWTAEGAMRDIRPVLTAHGRPTAVVAASDEMAIGVVAAARALGIDVPGQLSVIGIDDHALSGVLGLTTVRQDLVAQGDRVARVLLSALQGGDVGPVNQVLPTMLVERSTTAPPRG